MNNHWLHRITYAKETAEKKFAEGYLTVGWGACRDDPIDDLKEGGKAFKKLMKEHGYTGPSRWGLWRFLQFAVGDTVVVPRGNKEFAICEIAEPPRAATEVSDGRIGFVAKIKEGWKTCPRSFATPALQARMKMRQTNGDLNDLAQDIDRAIGTASPVYSEIHGILTEISAENRKTFERSVTPDNLEKIVRWYMKKIGAEDAYIPAKNEHGKEDMADADVVATFSKLHIIVYIQVKNHVGETGVKAVKQIAEYVRQKKKPCTQEDEPGTQEDGQDDFLSLAWVISTGEFTEDAQMQARKEGVRLIDGEEFFEMLLDCGIGSIGEAFP